MLNNTFLTSFRPQLLVLHENGSSVHSPTVENHIIVFKVTHTHPEFAPCLLLNHLCDSTVIQNIFTDTCPDLPRFTNNTCSRKGDYSLQFASRMNYFSDITKDDHILNHFFIKESAKHNWQVL